MEMPVERQNNGDKKRQKNNNILWGSPIRQTGRPPSCTPASNQEEPK